MTSPLLLIVDDEFGVRESLKMVFGKDFRLMEAESVEAAIPIVLDSKPNVVLLDVLMPKTDGIEALRRIKELQPACEVIMLTGVNSQQLSTQALNSGAFDFVAKPFDVVDLRQKVGRALQNTQQQTSKS
jgi:DNA-binding NtrC family response regulator